jgi:hypothetical protein
MELPAIVVFIKVHNRLHTLIQNQSIFEEQTHALFNTEQCVVSVFLRSCGRVFLVWEIRVERQNVLEIPRKDAKAQMKLECFNLYRLP